MKSIHPHQNDMFILAPSLAFRSRGLAPEIAICAVFAMAVSSVMVIGQYIVETGGYHLFLALERRGLVRRFAPHVSMKVSADILF